MSWKNWGDHPVVVSICVVAALGSLGASVLPLITSINEKQSPQSINGEGNIQIEDIANTDISNNNNKQVIMTEQGNINLNQSQSGTLSVPCFDGGGSGGWMFGEEMPEHYFPIGIITVNGWPLRSIPDHPMYNPDAPWNEYGTCIIVPAKYP
jgi:hypothetical protein